MYVCICNALRDRELAAAAKGDVRSVAQVFRQCGRKPQCGKCLPDVAKIIEDTRAETATAIATAIAAE